MVLLPRITSTFKGLGAFTQLISENTVSDCPPYVNDTHGQYYLDNSEPYVTIVVDPEASSSTVIQLSDEPSWPALSYVSFAANFKDYCKFKPDAGNPEDNIYITLGTFDWHWVAESQKI